MASARTARRRARKGAAGDVVFLDTGIFVAFLDRSHRHHADARALFAAPPHTLISSLVVFSETWSFLLHRHGEEPARVFRDLVATLPNVELLEQTTARHQATLRVLDRLRGTKLTYVDASSLAIIEARRIPVVWSTDHHLGLTGASVRP